MEIILIYAKSDTCLASDIELSLLEDPDTAIKDRQEGLVTFNSSKHFCPQNSAIVVVTDAAVEDKRWQLRVRSLESGVRLIPVGMTEHVNYNDDAVMPQVLSEINFIPLDEHTLLFIRDSLTTPPGLYEMTAIINDQMKQWDDSGSALLNNVIFIKEATEAIQTRLFHEQDPVLLERFLLMEEFLRQSFMFARKQRFRRWRYYAATVICTIISIFCLYFLIFMMPDALRMRREQLHYGHTLTWQTPQENPAAAAISALYILNDKPSSENILHAARNQLASALDEPHWSGPLLGDDYRYALNDYSASFDSEGRLLVLTCDGNGYVSKWDLNTANIVEQTRVSARPLYKMASDAGMLAAIDFDAKVYLKRGENSDWNLLMDFPQVWTRGLLLQNGRLVAYDDQKLIIYDIASKGVTIKLFSRIYDVEFLTDDTLALLVLDGDSLEYMRILRTGNTESQPFDATLSQNKTRDKILDISPSGDLIFLDIHKELVYWHPGNPSQYVLTGFYASRLASIFLFPDQVAAVADIDWGIHLYDINRKIFLGRLHLPIASPRFVCGFDDYLFAGDDNCRLTFRKISDFKVVSEPLEDQVLASYQQTQQTGNTGKIRSIRPLLEDSLLVELMIGDTSQTMYINGKNLSKQSSGYMQTLLAALPAGANPLAPRCISYLGSPCVVGILPGGDGLVFGTTSGDFNAFLLLEDDSFILQHWCIPSHLPIQSIKVGTDSYWLTDTGGNCWHVSMTERFSDNISLAKELAKRGPIFVNHNIFRALPKWMVKRFNVVQMPYSEEGFWEVDK